MSRIPPMGDLSWRKDKARQMTEHHEKRIIDLTKIVTELERLGHDTATWKTEIIRLQSEIDSYKGV